MKSRRRILTQRNIIEVEDDEPESDSPSRSIDTSVIPDDVMNLFWYFFGYSNANISYIRVGDFIKEYELDLTKEQKLFLFNLKFRTL